MNIDIQYNTPFEVTALQYRKLLNDCAGIVAGREEAGKYFVKVLLMKYIKHVKVALQ